MPSFNNITTLSLGNTFGAWYNKTNEIIDQLNLLDVASITGGDGIQIKDRPSPFTGGYTVEFSGNVTKNTTFAGNVSIAGTLTYGALNSQMTSTEINLPYETGITVGNIVYMKPDGYLAKAQANDECAAEVVGIVKGISGNQATIATTGKISGASMAQLITGITGATFMPGTVYFLSEGLSGIGTTLEPNVTDYISKPVVLGLTGDTALILPYRGFIAYYGTGGNSTTVVTGACGAGVLSINGISGALFTGSFPGNRRTTGHLVAVNSLGFSNLGGSVNPSTQIPVSGLATINKVSPLSIFANSLSTFSTNELPTGTNLEDFENFTTTIGSSPSQGSIVVHSQYKLDGLSSSRGYLFSTTGLTGDCYKLIDLKVTVLNNSNNYFYPNINFVLKRAFNFANATNYVNFDPSTDRNIYVVASTVNGPGTDIVLEYRMKTYTLFGRGFSDINAGGVVEWKYVPTGTVTPAQELLTPLFRKNNSLPVEYGSGLLLTGATACRRDGTLDSSGEYPVIYRENNSNILMGGGRTQVWKFNNVTLDHAIINKGVECVLKNRWYYEFTPTLGLTLSSDIIGHIRGLTHEGGAVSESLYINFPSYFLRQLQTPTELTPLSVNVELSLCKYDPTTGVTSNPFIIRKEINYTVEQFKIQGRQAIVVGS